MEKRRMMPLMAENVRPWVLRACMRAPTWWSLASPQRSPLGEDRTSRLTDRPKSVS